MRVKKPIPQSLEGIRLVNGRDGARYSGMGLNTFRKWAEKIGASRKIGGKRLYDKVIIDEHLDNLDA